jgi:ribosomal protein S18 acetylase RimI-like enzyme
MSETHEARLDVVVRTLGMDDLDAVVRIDARNAGAPRRDYFKFKIADALERSSVRVSLAAEHQGTVVGFLIASVFYGDFGVPEPQATLEAIGVQPEMAGRGVGRALWRQLVLNLRGMRVEKVVTQVDWAAFDLIGFFHHLGFAPSRRLSLERTLDFDPREEDSEDEDDS